MSSSRPAPKTSVGKPDVLKDTKNLTIIKHSETPCETGAKPMMKESDLKSMEEGIEKTNAAGEPMTKETNERTSTLGPPTPLVIDPLGLNLIKLFTRDNTVPFPDKPNQEYFRSIEAIEEMIQTINEGGDSLEAWKKMDSYPMLTKEEMRQWVLAKSEKDASPDHPEQPEEARDGSEKGKMGGEE